jgi:hypothetical protein
MRNLLRITNVFVIRLEPNTVLMETNNDSVIAETELPFNTFEARLIHQEKFYRFWEETLDAPHWVLEILKNGYKLPLKEWPPQYQEQNNKTARDNMQIIRQLMSEMIEKGVVKVSKNPPPSAITRRNV